MSYNQPQYVSNIGTLTDKYPNVPRHPISGYSNPLPHIDVHPEEMSKIAEYILGSLHEYTTNTYKIVKVASFSKSQTISRTLYSCVCLIYTVEQNFSEYIEFNIYSNSDKQNCFHTHSITNVAPLLINGDTSFSVQTHDSTLLPYSPDMLEASFKFGDVNDYTQNELLNTTLENV
tara:strand:- start:127 stop:651 length:525 start_codon:yes stop_codon:yes gene_type:complete